MSREEVVERLGIELETPFSSSVVRKGVERLYQTDRFRSVVVRARPHPEGGVALEIDLEARRRVVGIQVVGQAPLGVSWVRGQLGLGVQSDIDDSDLPALQRRLQAALRFQGYRNAQVEEPRLEPLDDFGRVLLVFHVNPGPPTRLAEIRLRGSLPVPSRRVSVGLKPGDVLDLTRVRPALARLEDELKGLGYFDAEISPPKVRLRDFTGDPPRADLIVEVDAGPKVEILFAGNRRVALRRLREDAEILAELGTGPAALLEGKERILARYERLGYFRARVDVAGRTADDRSRRQVLFRIREGSASRVVDVSFPGAEFFPHSVLADQVKQTVVRFLKPVLGRPGVDPAVVDRVLRGQNELVRRQPSTAPPDPGRVFVPRAYRAAVDALGDLYRSAGFQRARVQQPQVSFDEQGLVRVAYPVEEGRRWRIQSLVFSGHPHIFGRELLETVAFELSADGGQPLTFEAVEAGRRSILSLYGDKGYIFATVEEEIREAPERGDRGGRFSSARDGRAPVCEQAEPEGQSYCPVEVAYRIEEGPRVRVGDIIIRGLEKTRPAVVEGEVRFMEGEYLSNRSMSLTRDNLIRLGIFDRVVVRPVEEERPSPVKDVLIEVRERDNLSLELGIGASTEEGLRVFGGFADRNLFGTALRLQLNVKVNLWTEQLLTFYEETLQAQIRQFYRPFSIFDGDPLVLFEYEVAAGLSYPRIFLLPDGFSFGFDVIVLRDYDPAFAESNQRVTVIGNYDGFRPMILGDERPLAVQLRANFERSELDCNDAVEGREDLCSSGIAAPGLGDRTEGQNVYFGVGPRVSWDFRDDPLDPRLGFYLELEGEIADGLDPQSPDYARFEGRLSAYAPLAPRVTFVTSLRGGQIFPFATDAEIPLNRRFYAGGRSTVRGYPEKTLLPQDTALGADGQPLSSISTGGLRYLALKLELRIVLVSPVSIAGFFDVGDLWRLSQDVACPFALDGVCTLATGQPVPRYEAPCEVSGLSTVCVLPDGAIVRRRLAQGGGFGVRVATPIGPLSVDLGFPINRRDPFVEDWTVHFSVGSF